MQNRRNAKMRGFTLAELLVALSVSGIVLAAVATLAFAMGAAYDQSDDTNVKQARIRYTRVVLNDLFSNCKMVFFDNNANLAVWKEDDGDGLIQADELVYIDRGVSKDHISLVSFENNSSSSISIANIKNGTALTALSAAGTKKTTALIADNCREVWYRFDTSAPYTRFVNISFETFENGRWKDCQMNFYVAGWTGNLLNASGTALVSDDD